MMISLKLTKSLHLTISRKREIDILLIFTDVTDITDVTDPTDDDKTPAAGSPARTQGPPDRLSLKRHQTGKNTERNGDLQSGGRMYKQRSGNRNHEQKFDNDSEC